MRLFLDLVVYYSSVAYNLCKKYLNKTVFNIEELNKYGRDWEKYNIEYEEGEKPND